VAEADDDDLRINTLHRFAKHSPKLILHEYSHCEVPAGCGGVVLRWLDPDAGRPVTLRLISPGTQCEVWLDGEALPTSLANLRKGPHVLALHLARREAEWQPFTFTVRFDSRQESAIVEGSPQWRCSLVKPPEGWTAYDFDDTAWPEPPRAQVAQLANKNQWVKSSYTERIENGEDIFGLDQAELWVRLAFTGKERPQDRP
jgi:hypothetical protein